MKTILAVVALGLSLVAINPSHARESNTITVAQSKIKTLTFDVANMTCKMCDITVRKAIEGVDGVKSVKVNYDKKLATVVLDTRVAKVSAIEKATLNTGYPATLKTSSK